MCGRFVSKVDAAIERHFNLVRPNWEKLWASYNVAPSQQVPIVRLLDGENEGAMVRWGLVPAWAKGEPTRFATFNARAETVDKAASYRTPWRRRQRCVIPALGYYEWQTTDSGKQPYFLRLAGGEPFAFAGLWDRSVKPDGEAIDSCTIITVPANPMVAQIHTKARMPAMLELDTCTAWLESDETEARSMLGPYPADRMDAYPVSPAVNSPKNNGPELLERIR